MRKPRSEYPSEQADKFLLRFPDGMRERLKMEAEVNQRSMNAEIVSRLAASLASEDREFGGSISSPKANDIAEKIVDRVIARVNAMSQGAEVRIKVLEDEVRMLRSTEGKEAEKVNPSKNRMLDL